MTTPTTATRPPTIGQKRQAWDRCHTCGLPDPFMKLIRREGRGTYEFACGACWYAWQFPGVKPHLNSQGATR